MFDTHTHLHEETFQEDREEILEELRARDIRGVLVGTDTDTSRQGIDLARQSASFWSAVGVHPHEAQEVSVSRVENEIRPLLAEDVVVGVGECGLDYASDLTDTAKENQKSLFQAHLRLAHETEYPVIIHTRDAWEDTYDLLKEVKQHPLILHCFTGDAAWANRFLTDFPHLYVSFSGIVTFKKNVQDIQSAARLVPPERMLAETDSPYLAPEPYRGKRNDTRTIYRVIQTLANLKGMSFEQLDQILDANAREVFGFGPEE
jgi:TatD DNase family protein